MILSPTVSRRCDVPCCGTRYGCRIREGVNEPVDCDLGVRRVITANAQGRIGRRTKIDMELPALDLGQWHAAVRGAVNGQKEFVPSRRRRAAGAEARRDQAVGISQASGRNGKGDGVGGTTTEHRRAIERENAHPLKGGLTSKQVYGQKIGVLGRVPATVPHR